MTLLYPEALALLGLALPLVALYMLKARRPRIEVPSVLLWKALSAREHEGKPLHRLRRSLLLWLQLLILALLSLAAARPAVLTSLRPLASSTVVILDASASMDPHIEKARAMAMELVRAMGHDDEVMLVRAGARTEVICPFTRDREVLGHHLDALEVDPAEGQLKDAVALALGALQSRPAGQAMVLTDRAVTEAQGLLEAAAERVRVIRVGEMSDNVGIVGLDVRPLASSPTDGQALVLVGNASDKERTVTVEARLGDTMLDLQTLTLPAGGEGGVILPVTLSRPARLDIAVSPGGALDLDDKACLFLSPPRPFRVMVEAGGPFLDRVLRASGQVALVTDNPEVTVAVGQAPASLAPALVFAPPQGGGLVTVSGQASQPRVVRWSPLHPVTRLLDLREVLVSRAQIIQDSPPGLEAVVEADQGPLILAGEGEGRRLVYWAMLPRESDMPLRVAFPVAIMSSLAWLANRQAEPGGTVVPSGATLDLPLAARGQRAMVDLPDGSAVEVPLEAGGISVAQVQLGPHRLRAEGRDDLPFCTALLSRGETGLASPEGKEVSAQISAQGHTAQPLAPAARELAQPLAALALLVLLGEWWIFHRRRAG